MDSRNDPNTMNIPHTKEVSAAARFLLYGTLENWSFQKPLKISFIRQGFQVAKKSRRARPIFAAMCSTAHFYTAKTP